MHSVSHFKILRGDKQPILTCAKSIRHGRRGLEPKATIENSEVPCFAVMICRLEGNLKSVTSGLCRILDRTFSFFFFFFCVIDNCSFVTLSYLGETPGVCDCST